VHKHSALEPRRQPGLPFAAMALIECPDCGREVSSGAAHCLRRGCPIASRRDLASPASERSWIDRLFIAVVLVCFMAALVIIVPNLGSLEEWRISEARARSDPDAYVAPRRRRAATPQT